MRLSHIAVVCCLVTIFAVALKPVTDPDFWWHLATGRYMVTHHLIPTHDVFSLTAMSHRWITHEWLTELLFYGGWVLGGTRLLILVTASVITLTFWIVYLAARERGAPPLLSAPLVLLAALASAHTWGTRPQMLSLLLMALFTLALTRMIVRQTAAPPYWLPLVMVLWVNLHGGFIFGLALLALATIGYAVQAIAHAVQPMTPDPDQAPPGSWDQDKPDQARRSPRLPVDLARCAAVVVVAGLATLINPNGLTGALYPLSYLGNNASTRYIAEWVSPDFHQVQYLLFEALVLILLIGALAGAKRARLADILVLVPFTYLAFDSVRNISLFSVIAAPIAAELVTALLPRVVRMRRLRIVTRGKALLNLSAAIVISLGVLASSAGKLSGAAQAKAVAALYPVGALRYIQRHGLPLRGFDSYNWGGYLIWNLYPWRHVFVDGRPDMYGDHFMDRYITAYTGNASWRTLFATNSLCYALIEPGSGIAHALSTDRAWVLRYHDSHAVLYQAARQAAACRP
jgi:hypothetical protein